MASLLLLLRFCLCLDNKWSVFFEDCSCPSGALAATGQPFGSGLEIKRPRLGDTNVIYITQTNMVSTEPNVDEYAKRYPLHHAVITNDATLVEEIIHQIEGSDQPLSDWVTEGYVETLRRPTDDSEKKRQIFLNHRDWNGNPALHLAIHLKNKDIVRILLQRGADPSVRNGGGYSSMQEAIPTGEVEIPQMVYESISNSTKEEYLRRAPLIFAQLMELPDFTCDVHWEMKTWVPLLSWALPNDTLRLYKSGDRLRIDATLLGLKGLRWQRGNISFLLSGREQNGSVVILDHQNKIVQYLGTDDIRPKNLKKLLSRTTVKRGDVNTSNVSMVSSQSWMGGFVMEQISGCEAQMFDVEGLIMKIQTRKRDKNAREETKLSPSYFIPKKNTGKGEGLLYSYETLSVDERNIKSTVYLADSSPFDIRALLPLIEAAIPRAKQMKHVLNVLRVIPHCKMPVKLDVPIFATVSANATVSSFERKKPGEDLFVIDESYRRGKVEFFFDAQKREEGVEDGDDEEEKEEETTK
ncbi:ankyrin repeat domain-containing protein 13C [Planoprotostelium fungivorum]|uniref:Ankyrin repeat domain-containing protein 13C n=1 Tax=Planoprotostelium fungivorum TaxID=1890364 RepID=A0A2P6NNC4_9EUKA|nr:ankyrin repeat domain-containing protein 13C [Planoprotostelium fungivorum]